MIEQTSFAVQPTHVSFQISESEIVELDNDLIEEVSGAVAPLVVLAAVGAGMAWGMAAGYVINK